MSNRYYPRMAITTNRQRATRSGLIRMRVESRRRRSVLSTVGRHFAGKPLVLIACCVAILGCRDNYYPLETYYPLSAFQNCIEGVVIFDVLIDVDGNIKEADVISSHPAGVFEEAATKALQLKKFDKTGEEYRTDRTITYSIEDIEDCRRHYGVQ